MDDEATATALADRYWEQLLELEPTIGTSIGDDRYDDLLGDPSATGRAKSEAVHRKAIEETATIDRAGLEPGVRGALDILDAIARRHLRGLELRTDLLQSVNHLWGPSQVLVEIASIQQADTPERLDKYEARLRRIPEYLEVWGAIAGESVTSGVTSPRVVAQRTIAQLERLLSLPPESSPALLPLGEDDAAKERIAGVAREVVNPALAKFLEAIRGVLPHATESIGLSDLPGGHELYAAAIEAWTTLPLDAREVHDLGNDRFDSIQQERIRLAERLGFNTPEDAVAAHDSSAENRFSSRQDLVRFAEEQVERSWAAAPAFFGRLPTARCEVKAVEEFREADMPFAFYNPSTADGSRPGVYYVNAYDLPSRRKNELAAVSYHEANPGHHFQTSLSQELQNVPELMRFGGFLAGSAFSEGWGLYCERLADEMGLYLDDWERLGMLEAQALRAGRLITDTGIHALGWTRDRAIAKLEEAGTIHTDAVIEIDRYIALPGQALSYMTGMIEIEKARQAASQREGAAFSLRSFHDRLLGLGDLPLQSLRREFG